MILPGLNPIIKAMPALNVVKQYVIDGYYHVYNRGVEKRDIFLDQQDYSVFLRFLKEYLLPLNHPDLKTLQGFNPRRRPKNYSDQITLLAYCLMPNHFHLFIKQKTHDGLKQFMTALGTNYVMYFNHKNDRVGPLFQGVYKAALIAEEPYYLHISRYIHRNPRSITRVQPLHTYPYSSYRYFLNEKAPDWLHPHEILSMFRSGQSIMPRDILSYQSFVEHEAIDDEAMLGRLRLEE